MKTPPLFRNHWQQWLCWSKTVLQTARRGGGRLPFLTFWFNDFLQWLFTLAPPQFANFVKDLCGPFFSLAPPQWFCLDPRGLGLFATLVKSQLNLNNRKSMKKSQSWLCNSVIIFWRIYLSASLVSDPRAHPLKCSNPKNPNLYNVTTRVHYH